MHRGRPQLEVQRCICTSGSSAMFVCLPPFFQFLCLSAFLYVSLLAFLPVSLSVCACMHNCLSTSAYSSASLSICLSCLLISFSASLCVIPSRQLSAGYNWRGGRVTYVKPWRHEEFTSAVVFLLSQKYHWRELLRGTPFKSIP